MLDIPFSYVYYKILDLCSYLNVFLSRYAEFCLQQRDQNVKIEVNLGYKGRCVVIKIDGTEYLS